MKFRIGTCFFIALSAMIITFSCKKKDDNNNPVPAAQIPVLTTTPLSGITQTSAICGGNITNTGGASVTAKGVCWSQNHTPTIADNKTNEGTGSGIYTSNITGLTGNNIFYVRAYATNSAGTAYGNEIIFGTEGTVTDIDGNVYRSVTIGTQVWMLENLKVKKFRNGDSLHNSINNTDWSGLTSGAFCNYSNDINFSEPYGLLYNWYAVNDSRNIAPDGWHVPTSSDWATLDNYLINNGYGYLGSGADIGKSLASTTYWNVSSIPGTVGNDPGTNNTSGFTALPGGYRLDTGPSTGMGSFGNWWSSNEASSSSAYAQHMDYSYSSVPVNAYPKRFGFNIRCIKD